MQEVLPEVRFEDEYQVYLSTTEGFVNLFLTDERFRDRKVSIGIETLMNLSGDFVFREVEYAYTSSFHLGVDGIAEQQEEDDGHDQQDKHGSLIAEYMMEFLADK